MQNIAPGVLNSDQLRELQDEGVIQARAVEAQGSAFDLHLGSSGWSLRGSIKQISGRQENVESVCGRFGQPFDLDAGGIELKRGQVAVVGLEESVDFSQHPWLMGEATGKSSIGRLDILTRLLVDDCPEYERVPPKYKGRLYVEIAPISFDIRIHPGNSLNQLRVHCGPPSPMPSLIGRRLLFDSHDGAKFAAEAQNNCTLSLDLSNRSDVGAEFCAYVLKRGPLPTLDFNRKGRINSDDYFETARSEAGALQIEVDRFYILRSVERLYLPEDIAVTGMAYSENLGELRIHYAGFAHPWFGRGRKDTKTGAPLIFEVRAHNFPIVLRQGEVFATIKFFRMSEKIPDKDKNTEKDDYSNQELKLSNYFGNTAVIESGRSMS